MNTTTVILPENGGKIILPKQEQTFGLIKFNITDTAIAEMKEKYMSLKIDGINDKHGFNIVHEARMDVKGKRIAVDKRRKELNESAKDYITSVNNEAKRITDLLKPIEDSLEWEEGCIEKERETLKREAIERENKRIQDRINQISAYGYAVDYSEIKSMTDIAFADLLEQVRFEHQMDLERKANAEEFARQERGRLIAERAELEELRKKQVYEANIAKAEQVRIQKEQEAREAAIKAEREKIDAEKKVIHRESLQAAFSKVGVERIGVGVYVTEQAKEAINKSVEEERELAFRPDKEKIQEFKQWLVKSINYPSVKSKEAQQLLDTVDDKLDDIYNLITIWLSDPSVLLAEYSENDLITLVKEA